MTCKYDDSYLYSKKCSEESFRQRKRKKGERKYVLR